MERAEAELHFVKHILYRPARNLHDQTCAQKCWLDDLAPGFRYGPRNGGDVAHKKKPTENMATTFV